MAQCSVLHERRISPQLGFFPSSSNNFLIFGSISSRMYDPVKTQGHRRAIVRLLMTATGVPLPESLVTMSILDEVSRTVSQRPGSMTFLGHSGMSDIL